MTGQEISDTLAAFEEARAVTGGQNAAEVLHRLRCLDAVIGGNHRLGAIEAHTGLSRSAVSRYLGGLVEHGALVYTTTSGWTIAAGQKTQRRTKRPPQPPQPLPPAVCLCNGPAYSDEDEISRCVRCSKPKRIAHLPKLERQAVLA